MPATTSDPTRAGRRRGVVIGGIGAGLVIGLLAWRVVADDAPETPIDEPEGCVTAVYEGCPERWEVEWENPYG